MKKTATVYRMHTPEHLCPYGLKTVDLLKREGYQVDDRILKSREEADRFKSEHQVKTTPQVFINDARVGGYEDLRRFLGKPVHDPKATTYRPVVVLFTMAGLIALSITWLVHAQVVHAMTLEWFISISMCLLALQKLKDIESFSTMFLSYDLLAQRWVPYGRVYPFAEALAGVLMLAGALTWISAPVALFIGGVGAISVFKAVYIDRRELKCACVGGDSKVPLGFVSLTENLMMIGMALWMAAREILS